MRAMGIDPGTAICGAWRRLIGSRLRSCVGTIQTTLDVKRCGSPCDNI